MNAKTNRVPPLRFPEFKGEWTLKRLGDVSNDVMYGLNSAAVVYDGLNKYIRITDIDEESREFKPAPLTSPHVVIDDRYKLRKGDIVFARTGASTGKTYLYKSSDGNLYFAGYLIRFSIDEANPYFVYSQTLRQPFAKWLRAMSMRSGQPGINAEEYKSFRLAIPPTLKEQQKISAFLTAVDEKLKQLATEKELLLKYKKGVIQQLFDHKIRFKDEKGGDFRDWREEPLRKHLVESRVPGSKGHIAKKITVKLWGKGVYEKDNKVKGSSSTQYYKRQAGQLIYSKLDFLNCAFGIIPEALEGYESTVDLPCFDISNALNPQFLLLTVTREQFYLRNGMTADGSRKARRIHAETFLDFCIDVPAIAEQNKIMNFVGVLERKIDLTDQQLITVKNFKAGLLQQMFV